MKKFDCFKFFNEVELLHLRFLEYYDYIDYFVIVEATKTHTGKPKELLFPKIKDKFKDYINKVIYVEVHDLPDYSLNDIWKAENYQRNCIMRGLEGKAQPGDKIFVSDCDELWDTATADLYIERKDWITFNEHLFYYYVNCQQNCLWNGPIMAPYGSFDSPQTLRNAARSGLNSVFPGGWHYSYMGGADRIKEKVENIAESHLIIDKIGSLNDIQKKMETATDLWNRPDNYAKKNFINIQYKPKSLEKFLSIYPYFLKNI
jgi:beta-1,4-mannosyl-glycoprotein beta-1,4-N-acetylglucosaminyltransferase